MGIGSRKNNKRYPGIVGKRPDLKDFRRKEAVERQEYWNGLTNAQKLERLDTRLGKDVGAKKQRAKLTPKEANQNA